MDVQGAAKVFNLQWLLKNNVIPFKDEDDIDNIHEVTPADTQADMNMCANFKVSPITRPGKRDAD